MNYVSVIMTPVLEAVMIFSITYSKPHHKRMKLLISSYYNMNIKTLDIVTLS